LGSNKVHVIIIKNHSLGLSALDPLPSALEIDVEEDPVVDVCRRSERRDRSPVLFWTGDPDPDLVDNPGARLKRGNLILSVGVAFGPRCEGVTGLDTALLSTAVGELD
jgi:hypothetical protein